MYPAPATASSVAVQNVSMNGKFVALAHQDIGIFQRIFMILDRRVNIVYLPLKLARRARSEFISCATLFVPIYALSDCFLVA